ncbi:MAG: hypothetical protein IJ486_09830 [Firmicutes bacterium]|nr:hypothetical protein [Bacillota bacterium]
MKSYAINPNEIAIKDSPTTRELIDALKMYFSQGGALSILLHTPPVVSACLYAGENGVDIIFDRFNEYGDRRIYGSFRLEYSNFGVDEPGSYYRLTEHEEEEELEEILWNEFPELKDWNLRNE